MKSKVYGELIGIALTLLKESKMFSYIVRILRGLIWTVIFCFPLLIISWDRINGFWVLVFIALILLMNITLFITPIVWEIYYSKRRKYLEDFINAFSTVRLRIK